MLECGHRLGSVFAVGVVFGIFQYDLSAQAVGEPDPDRVEAIPPVHSHAVPEGASSPGAFDNAAFGDWGGYRSRLAESGVSLDFQWTQSIQSVVSGGNDSGWKYGGSLQFRGLIDLGQMEVIPGGFVSVLAEGRYGESVIGEAGTVLPVNTDLFFPITGELDDEILAITEISYTQFLSKQFGLTIGKFQTLDGDPNEFASGRGQSQFMNYQFVAPNLIGNAIPYSTLGAGVIFLPTDRLKITSLVVNTNDSSTTAGFDDIGEGTTWLTEAQLQYRIGSLPGGMNFGFAYAFDNEFLDFNSSGLAGEDIQITNDDETWAIYWSAWQYLVTLDSAPEIIAAGDGRPDIRGLGVFARVGVVDKDTNIVNWSASIGFGGRGMIPTREEDVFGAGFVYTKFNDDRQLIQILAEEEAYGLEAFYSFAIAPGVALTGDIQVIEPATRSVDTTVIVGCRLSVRF